MLGVKVPHNTGTLRSAKYRKGDLRRAWRRGESSPVKEMDVRACVSKALASLAHSSSETAGASTSDWSSDSLVVAGNTGIVAIAERAGKPVARPPFAGCDPRRARSVRGCIPGNGFVQSERLEASATLSLSLQTYGWNPEHARAFSRRVEEVRGS